MNNTDKCTCGHYESEHCSFGCIHEGRYNGSKKFTKCNCKKFELSIESKAWRILQLGEDDWSGMEVQYLETVREILEE